MRGRPGGRRILLAVACLLLPGMSLSADERPNILLIVADDLGYSDLGCYGGEIATPNLDRLARQGLRFTQFYNNAICTGTRASLVTGLYPRQVGLTRLQRCVTSAEVLRAAGYRTLMAGKWHLAGDPRQRGFQKYFGLLTGCCNQFNPGARRPGEPEPGKKFVGDNQPFAVADRVVKPYTPTRGFYTTDAFTDSALRFLGESDRRDQPFFLYVAYTVPHYPLHAPPEDIARYRGKFLSGWDELRKKRLERMKRLGLVDANLELPPRNRHAPAWDDIDDKDAWDLKMAVYAAMVDRMDRNIGRLLERLRSTGQEENTLVLFFSDNGPSDEDRTSTPEIPPGPVESYRTVDLPWANLSNTPFRHFKRWNHEGGISTPLIARWPRVIKTGGRITARVGHVIDIMATCVDIAGATYPKTVGEQKIPPLEGRSLLPILSGKPGGDQPRTLYWNQRALWRAVRRGRWKLVSPDHTYQYNPWRAGRKGRVLRKPPADLDQLWELYDVQADRTEMNNLARKHPERVRELADLYAAWDRRVTASR